MYGGRNTLIQSTIDFRTFAAVADVPLQIPTSTGGSVAFKANGLGGGMELAVTAAQTAGITAYGNQWWRPDQSPYVFFGALLTIADADGGTNRAGAPSIFFGANDAVRTNAVVVENEDGTLEKATNIPNLCGILLEGEQSLTYQAVVSNKNALSPLKPLGIADPARSGEKLWLGVRISDKGRAQFFVRGEEVLDEKDFANPEATYGIAIGIDGRGLATNVTVEKLYIESYVTGL